MSTLSSSVSPAASPRASFLIPQSRPSANYSPRPNYSASSYRTYSTSPSPRSRAAFNAPSTSTYISTGSGGAGAKVPREHFVESAAVETTSRYADAGTQYSPDGFPPTYTGDTCRSGGQGKEQEERPDETEVATTTKTSPPKKRKERANSLSPTPMSTSTASSADSSSQALRPPPEPEARRDPTPIPPTPQNNVTGVAGPSTNPNNEQAEPQEARSTAGHSSAPKRSRPEPGSAKVMPLLYQDCKPKDLGVLISSMLMELIRLNDQIPLRDGRLTRFHSRAPPGISVSDYLQRLIHHATLPPPILLSLVWYIDRLCQLYPAFTINSLTVHRFLITATCVAAKGLSDSFWTNPIYARIGGIPVSELATLELEFLTKVQWKIVPKPEVLEDYYRSLVERTEGYELESEPGSTGSSSLGESEEGSKGSEVGNKDDDMIVDEPT